MEDGIPTWIEVLGLQPDQPAPQLTALVRLLAQAADMPMAALWIIDGAKQRLAAVHGLEAQELPAQTRLADQAAQETSMFTAEADGSDPLMISLRLTRFAAIAVRGPEHRRLGLLCVMDRVGDAVLPRVGEALRDSCAILESWLELRHDAQHDRASGALACRPFVELGDREWRRAMRGLYPIGVLVLQVDQEDDLRVNSEAEYERALRAAAVCAQYAVYRPGDVACRYDRSRLALMLPGADENGTLATADRIRASFAALAIPLPSGGHATLSAAVQWVGVEALSRGSLATTVSEACAALDARARKPSGPQGS